MPGRNSLTVIPRKLVFALRYDYGFSFLDRCGSTINDILRQHPDWQVPAVNPQGCALRDPDTEATLHFSSQKLDFSQEVSNSVTTLMPVDDFAQLAKDLTATIVDRLDLTAFTRIGFRVWHLIPYDSLDRAKEAVKALALVNVERMKEIGIEAADEVTSIMVAERETCMTRIAVSAVELSALPGRETLEIAKIRAHTLHLSPEQKADRKQALVDSYKAKKIIENLPQFAVCVDTDHFLRWPPYPDRLDVMSDFILPHHEWSKQFVRDLFHSGQKG